MVDAKTGFEMAEHIDEVDGDGDDKVMARINARVNAMPNYTTY